MEFERKQIFTPNPQPVLSLLGVRINKIACGQDHVLAMSEDKELFSWGSNHNSQLGIPKRDTIKVTEFSSFSYEDSIPLVSSRSGETNLEVENAPPKDEDFGMDSQIEKKRALTTTKKATLNYHGTPHRLSSIQGRIENISCGDLTSYAVVKL